MRWQRLFILTTASIAFAGCVTNVQPPTHPQAQTPTRKSPGHFEPVQGRGPDVIAELRAAPAPAQPEFLDGKSEEGDEHLFSAKGFVIVANGEYAGIDADARAWLQQRGREIGADKVMFYTETDESTHAPQLKAVYYIRFKLPFGATFRDLHANEIADVGGKGVSIGSVVGGSPADRAGLINGDIILKINEEAVLGLAQFQKQLRAHMGKKVSLTIRRGGVTSSRTVQLGVLASELNKKK